MARASRPWVRVNGKPCVVTERGSAEMAWPQALAPERSAGVGAGRLKCFGLVFAPFELLRGHHSGAWFRSPIPFNRGSLGLHGFDFNRRFDRLKALSGVEGLSSIPVPPFAAWRLCAETDRIGHLRAAALRRPVCGAQLSRPAKASLRRFRSMEATKPQ